MARIPAHRRKRDPYGRAILAPRIPPPAQVPVAVRTDAEEDWPSPPVPQPGDRDRDDPELVCRKCQGPLTPCVTCGKPAGCGDSWCADCVPAEPAGAA